MSVKGWLSSVLHDIDPSLYPTSLSWPLSWQLLQTKSVCVVYVKREEWACLSEGRKEYRLSHIRHTKEEKKKKKGQKLPTVQPSPRLRAEWASSWPSQTPHFINKLDYLFLDYFHYRRYLQSYQDPNDLIRSQRDTADNCFLTALCPQPMRLLRVWYFCRQV